MTTKGFRFDWKHIEEMAHKLTHYSLNYSYPSNLKKVISMEMETTKLFKDLTQPARKLFCSVRNQSVYQKRTKISTWLVLYWQETKLYFLMKAGFYWHFCVKLDNKASLFLSSQTILLENWIFCTLIERNTWYRTGYSSRPSGRTCKYTQAAQKVLSHARAEIPNLQIILINPYKDRPATIKDR